MTVCVVSVYPSNEDECLTSCTRWNHFVCRNKQTHHSFTWWRVTFVVNI